MSIVFVIPMIHRASVSNGIRVLLDLANSIDKLGYDVSVYPTFSSRYFFSDQLDIRYRNLTISPFVPQGSTVIIPDTADPVDVDNIRHATGKIIWYSLAVPGMFASSSIPYIERLPGEKDIVYSSQVSTLFRSFYFQTSFPDIESFWLSRPPVLLDSKKNLLHIGFYQGKGSIVAPYSQEIKNLISSSCAYVITREYPSDKSSLYSLISRLDCLISLDPLSSLNYEAALLGVPVYVHNGWDECFINSFPVQLDGISFADSKKFLSFLSLGYDPTLMRNSYKQALERNPIVLDELVQYIESSFNENESRSLSYIREYADLVNVYWEKRQLNLSRLNLLELRKIYSREYIISGGHVSRPLLIYFIVKLFRFACSFVKAILGFPRAFCFRAIRLAIRFAST